MKKASKITLTLGALLVAASIPVYCSAEPVGCQAKRAAIEDQMAYARAYGNSAEKARMADALNGLNADCSVEGQKAVNQHRIDQAQSRLDERLRDLQEAKDEGQSGNRIAQRQRRVDEARNDLARAQAGIDR